MDCVKIKCTIRIQLINKPSPDPNKISLNLVYVYTLTRTYPHF